MSMLHIYLEVRFAWLISFSNVIICIYSNRKIIDAMPTESEKYKNHSKI